jgi:hypothetical protein
MISNSANHSGESLAGANLAGLDLSGANFDGADLCDGWLLECNLFGASLERAKLDRAWCAGACFRGASLHYASLAGTNLRGSDCRKANFHGANLAGATLDGADLSGADLSATNLNGASVARARFDADTQFPPCFAPGEEMEWLGDGPPPIAFDVFVKRLRDHVDPGRLARALEMLKGERFQLYSQVESSALCGVVKSQTTDGLVYSCRLDYDGQFGCCRQDLQPCLGLENALCKHILVLLVALTRSKQLDARTAGEWVKSSRWRNPTFGTEAMSETFLRYKSAEAGEIDWRPTETIPEDYYAL